VSALGDDPQEELGWLDETAINLIGTHIAGRSVTDSRTVVTEFIVFLISACFCRRGESRNENIGLYVMRCESRAEQEDRQQSLRARIRLIRARHEGMRLSAEDYAKELGIKGQTGLSNLRVILGEPEFSN